jgi:hypothetical protein
LLFDVFLGVIENSGLVGLVDRFFAEVPEGFGSPDEFAKLMTELPAWAEGLPLAAKARVSKRYAKEKNEALAASAMFREESGEPPTDRPEPDEPKCAEPRNNGHDSRASEPHGDSGPKQGRRIATYIYAHPDKPKYLRVDKYIAANGERHFYQYHWNDRRWVHKVKGTYAEIKIPYRLPELLAAPATEPAWICEGEKDADNVAALGLIATTNPGGAKVFQPELAPWFKNKQIAYILEDNDAAGREHTAKVTAVLTGIVPSIAVVAFPELPEKRDVSDWLELGGNKELLFARAEQALKTSKEQQDIKGVCAASIPMQVHDWLWRDRFAIGEIGLLVGMPDEGKGQCLANIAACVSRGLEWPINEGRAPPGNVILLTAEDDIRKTVVPRLAAAGADLNHIEILSMVTDVAKDGKQTKRMFSLLSDLERLVSAYLGIGKIDSYRTSDVRAVMGPLKDLAEELAVSVIGIMHFNKKADVTNVLLRVSDSLAFVAAPRHVFGIIDDPDNGRKLFVSAKNNLVDAQQKKRSLAFRFNTKQVGIDQRNGKAIVAPFIVWEPDYVDVSATEALSAVNENKSPTARDSARQFLHALLSNGPVAAKDIEEAAKANGISRSTLFRAKTDLNVIAVKDNSTPKGEWMWRLPG